MVKSINFNKDGIKIPRNSKQLKKDMGEFLKSAEIVYAAALLRDKNYKSQS